MAPTGHAKSGAWRSFFIWGWVPGLLEIDGAQACEEGHVREIHTQRSFLQGLVATFAGYYIDIYSPWTREIRCDAAR